MLLSKGEFYTPSKPVTWVSRGNNQPSYLLKYTWSLWCKTCTFHLAMVLKLLLHLFVLRSLVIDGLHNYKEPHRQTLPRSIQPQNREGASPMMAEETFAWLSRFKRILSSMNKTHHLFFLHRMVVHRNGYTEMCHTLGRKDKQQKLNLLLLWPHKHGIITFLSLYTFHTGCCELQNYNLYTY